jgi:acyl-CoA thioesterase
MGDIGTSEFDAATAMAPDADGCWRGALHDGWDIGGNANGGYTLACAVRALAGATGRAHPISVTAHYLAPGRPGAVSLDPVIVKDGKRFATASGGLVGANGREIIRVLGTFGDVLTGAAEPEHHSSAAPELAPFDECEEREPVNGGVPVPLMNQIDVRLDARSAGFQHGIRNGSGVMSGWFAFRDGRPIDPLALMLACDSFPPAVFHFDLPPGWVPTVELTVHVRDVPAPGPLRCMFRTRFVTNGMFEEDGELWDSRGRLVALSRQLALIARSG